MKKSVFWVSDLVGHKPGYTATEDGSRLEISDLENRGIVLSKANYKGIDQLHCNHAADLRFVFAYAKSRISRHCRVAMRQGKVREIEIFSRSGNCQGIL